MRTPFFKPLTNARSSFTEASEGKARSELGLGAWSAGSRPSKGIGRAGRGGSEGQVGDVMEGWAGVGYIDAAIAWALHGKSRCPQ